MDTEPNFEERYEKLLYSFKSAAEMGETISGVRAIAASANEILLNVMGTMGASKGALLTLDRGMLIVSAARGAQADQSLPLAQELLSELEALPNILLLRWETEFPEQLKHFCDTAFADLKVVLAVILRAQKRIVGFLLLSKRFMNQDYHADDLHVLDLICQHVSVALYNFNLRREIQAANLQLSDKVVELQVLMQRLSRTQSAAMVGLAKLAETRDPETGLHLERIRNYCRVVTEEMSKIPEYTSLITPEYIQNIYNSSPLHDIGKVGIPDQILQKNGKLTPEEFQIMQTHTVMGGNAMSAADEQLVGESFLEMAKEIAYAHHEKWDGSGYPYHLKGSDIPFSARIAALADVYDALTSKRVYKDALPHDRAKRIILEGAGQHFDVQVVNAFIRRESEFIKIRDEYFG
ncbi:MAG: HD domain-containing protein [bacterium]|nr:HD domain-containing protein [bacterium]